MTQASDMFDIQSGGDFAGSLDAALDFIRADAATTLPLYVLASAPTVLLLVAMLGDIAVHRPSEATSLCALLVPAMLWRWSLLLLLQRRVAYAMTGRQESRRFWKRLPVMLLLRLASALWLVWGIWLLVVMAVPAVLFGAWIGPTLLDVPVASLKSLRRPLLAGITSRPTWRQFGIALVIFLVAWVGVCGVCDIIAGFVLPSLLGISDSRPELLLGGSVLKLGLALVVWLAGDLLLHVTAVIEYSQVQSRHGGADLERRIRRLGEAA